jgi:hypothetical protein
VLDIYPSALIGGTGWNLARRLEDVGITSGNLDYSIYPQYRQSIGFTMSGCRFRCPFCVVPAKEGYARASGTVSEIWRGAPWPREIVLLDNDFFGNPEWRQRLAEIRDGRFWVCFTQGINARTLTPDQAKASPLSITAT